LEKKIQLKRFEEKKVAGFKTDKDPKWTDKIISDWQ
jgi:hypothetical protein